MRYYTYLSTFIVKIIKEIKYTDHTKTSLQIHLFHGLPSMRQHQWAPTNLCMASYVYFRPQTHRFSVFQLVHLEEVIAQRDQLIEELTVSLQRSIAEQDALKNENNHLSSEVQQLQHMVCERSQSEHDTIKAQLSDLVKYESMLKEDSTRFYSALMSGGSSVKSSNGEKDMDREEIVVSYSRSDLKSSEASDDFQTGFETKLSDALGQFDQFIEENLRNQLREKVLQVFADEVGKLRLEYDAEVKELETQLQQEKQRSAAEARRLRELLTSVKSGDADVDALRLELAVKHEKEMENLRMYFEKKCSDMERR